MTNREIVEAWVRANMSYYSRADYSLDPDDNGEEGRSLDPVENVTITQDRTNPQLWVVDEGEEAASVVGSEAVTILRVIGSKAEVVGDGRHLGPGGVVDENALPTQAD